MSFNAIPPSPKRHTLHDVVLEGAQQIAQSPYEWWRPLVSWLAGIHREGRHHGALMHGTVCFSTEGKFDLTHLSSLEGCPPEKDSAYRFYYPQPPDAVTEMQRDLHALAVLFYFGITGTMPSVTERNRIDLRAYEEGWGPEFIKLTEYLMSWPERMNTAGELVEQCWPPEADSALEPAPSSEPAVVETTVEADPPALLEPPRETEEFPPEITFTSQLPNTTIGKAVLHEIPPMLVVVDGQHEIASISVAQDLPPGLSFDGAMITGVPTQAGDYVLQFECKLKSHAASVVVSTRLTVNPDPRALWKDLPTDPALPFPKPDTAAHALPDAPLPVLAASRRGRSHAHTGSFRDDDFTIDYFPAAGWYLLAVADGAGSAKFSRRGSQIACETVQRLLAEQFENSASAAAINRVVDAYAATPNSETDKSARNEFYRILGNTAIQSRRAIEDASTAQAAALKDFNTTLIIVLARPTSQGWFTASFAIGDGAAGLAGVPADASCLITTPDGGEFAGQTVFLTMKEALATGDAVLKRLKLNLIPSFSALMVMTDGVSDPRFSSDDALAKPEPWQELWNELAPLIMAEKDRQAQANVLLEWLNFWSTGNHDDRTIAVLYQPQSP